MGRKRTVGRTAALASKRYSPVKGRGKGRGQPCSGFVPAAHLSIKKKNLKKRKGEGGRRNLLLVLALAKTHPRKRNGGEEGEKKGRDLRLFVIVLGRNDGSVRRKGKRKKKEEGEKWGLPALRTANVWARRRGGRKERGGRGGRSPATTAICQ